MTRDEFIPMFKSACYRVFAAQGIDILQLATEAESLPMEKKADAIDPTVQRSLISHVMHGLEEMNVPLGSLLMFGAGPAIGGMAAGYGAEKLSSPPTVSLKNARRAELLDAYDKALNEVQTRIDVRKRRAGM